MTDADATIPVRPTNPLARPADAEPAPDRRTTTAAARSRSAQRLRQPRTLISIGIPLILLVLIFRVALNVDFAQLAGSVAGANKALLLAAFLVFYAGFPIRGLRWSILLKGAGIRVGTKDATEILFLSWTVNCLVPAKLGDLYRAFLLKINADVSGSRTLGTVFIERILDLFAIALMGLRGGLLELPHGLPARDPVRRGPGHRRDRRARAASCSPSATSAARSWASCRSRNARSSSTTGSRRACSRSTAGRSCR